MTAYLLGVHYHLPEGRRTNADLVAANPDWNAEKIYLKTGIRSRPMTAPGETAADLGAGAAESLLKELRLDRSAIDALLVCTQSPDYILPTTACLLQTRLGLSTDCGALDVNLGCSGFTYGLWLASSLVRSGAARNVLLIATDTYSKYCSENDLTTTTIFADGGGAALISGTPDGALARLGETIVGTDGRGAENLIIRAGGTRCPRVGTGRRADNSLSDEYLHMNGPEIFAFTLTRIREAIQRLLDRLGLGWGDIDLFLLHQANRFILEQLGRRMGIPAEKMPIDLEEIGNTASASIPILMRRTMERSPDLFRPGHRLLLVGFGVGYSWAATELTWIRSHNICLS